MPSISGSFSGKVTQQFGLPLNDQSNHLLAIAEVNGIQKSPDPLWNDSKISYWGINDLLNGEGSQTGYFNNVHPDGGRDFGTFEGKVSGSGGTMTVEGTFKFTGGDGQYRGLTGGGTFKTVTKSETEVEATWNGAYELAKAQTG
jgi:hypothetical protein